MCTPHYSHPIVMENHGNGTVMMIGGWKAYRVVHQTDACVMLEEVCV